MATDPITLAIYLIALVVSSLGVGVGYFAGKARQRSRSITFRDAVDAAAAAKVDRDPDLAQPEDRAFTDGTDAVIGQLLNEDVHDGPEDMAYAYETLEESEPVDVEHGIGGDS